MPEFEPVWKRILAHEGETFRQVRGGEFTYTVAGQTLRLSRTNQNLSFSTLKQAYDRLPASGPGEFQDLRGPSYLYAILTDSRIA